MSIWKNAPKNTKAVFEHLKLLARLMRTAPYGEIAAAIGRKEHRMLAPLSLRFPLGFIRDHICRSNGLPWLNALAVNATTGLPGDDFLPPGIALGDDELVLWRGAVLAVYCYPWETVTFD